MFRDGHKQRGVAEGFQEAEECSPLGEVISQLVHEINNPLAAISGYAELALATPSDARLGEYLETIHQQAERCQTVVEGLSSLARRLRGGE